MKRCPRCGEMKLKEDIVTNALSRFRDEYICDDCGTEEALMSLFSGKDKREWWINKEGE